MDLRKQLASVVTAVCLFLLGLDTASAFEISYSYELLKGKERAVCQRMLEVYSTGFKKPWSADNLANQPRSLELLQTRFSRFPTSPEFDSVKWIAHPYEIKGSSNFALYSNIDIDNDGTSELVLKLRFFQGSPGTRDYLYVFPQGAIDFSEFRTHDDFLSRFIEKRITVLEHPVHQRPFIFRKRTYIHRYQFTPRTFPGANPDQPFGAPEYIVISEYRGPAKPSAKQMPKRGGVMREVCKFEMVQG